ncbi:MAG: hypothetical protein S4CHLAM123_14330 [Chlamydiales bacterium]|nr:hypothetical protein [Chlamydiales bacterium]
MKKPQKSPDLSTLTLQPEKLLTILKIARQFEEENLYLHWDKIFRRPDYKHLDNKELWFGIKILRASNQKKTPLLDKEKSPFIFSLPDFIVQSLQKIDTRGGKEFYSYEDSQTDLKKEYFIRSLINEAITSSQLEGASTTRKVANEMLRSGRAPRDKNERMIFNNYATMQQVVALKDMPLNVNTILEIHHLVTEHTLDDASAAGRLRKSNESVVIEEVATGEILHEPPKAAELPKRLKQLCDFANGKTPDYFVHPIIRAILVHFWLAYDHPFVDGNGRTARALFYWTVLHHNYRLFEFISLSEVLLNAPAKYGRSFLYTETDDNDLTYFIHYQIQVIEKSIEKLYEHVNKKTKEQQAFDTINQSLDLNFRQKDLLMHAQKHPHTQYTVQWHRTTHKIAYDTARHDLLDLEEKGILQKQRRGNAFVFTLRKKGA